MFLTAAFAPFFLRADFLRVMPGKEFSFPRDHGSHHDYPVEWWYFTGHLRTAPQDGEESMFGFELTFFRVAVNPTSRVSKSPWHVQSLFLAHAAITDDRNRQFYFEKRSRRPSFDIAGASDTALHVWLDDWRVKLHGSGNFHLSFRAVDERSKNPFSLELTLNSRKPEVLQGIDGYSQKGAEVTDASYYVSLTRLEGVGKVMLGGAEQVVSASAWMDHEILSSKPNDEEVGWDWFALQLDNDWECMIYHLRRGTPQETSPFSAGSCVNPKGESRALTLNDFTIEPLRFWSSPTSGIRYPAEWKISIRPFDIDVTVTPTVENQELASDSEGSTRTYWEGRSSLRGKMGGEPVTGSAYVELVGYKSE